MKINITINRNERKNHLFSKDVTISLSNGKPVDSSMKDFVIDSIIDWFEEYDNQPKASQLHPE